MLLKNEVHLPSVFEDLSLIFAQIPDTYVEFAIAAKGCSKFNKAIYLHNPLPSEIKKMSDKDMNISFLIGCEKQSITAPLSTIVARQGNKEMIHHKNLISFDIDFKDCIPNYSNLPTTQQTAYQNQITQQVIDKIKTHQTPLWTLVFSGHGLHLHFRLKDPISTTDTTTYRKQYNTWCDVLEAALGNGIILDRSCSNIARAMRLPGSTNWKNFNGPIKTQVLLHNPEANGWLFLKDYLNQQKPTSPAQHHTTHNEFIDLLKAFSYTKFDSIKNVGEQIRCSSPFDSDSEPSFYYHPTKKIYYDFSTGEGGTFSQLKTKLMQSTKIQPLQNKSSNHTPPQRYMLRQDGIWFQKPVENEDPENLWICSPLIVRAMTRDTDSGSWGRILQFSDCDGKTKRWAMPMEMMAGDGVELRRELLARGLRISTQRQARQHLMEYIQSQSSTNRVRCIKRLGWHDQSYALPQEVYNRQGKDEDVILQRGGDFESFQVKGSLHEWATHIAKPCQGHSRLTLALAAAFAPPLLHICGEESGGIHFVGSSSIGKTLALRIAGTVWGGGGISGFVRKWRSTVNGLESLAESRCDSLLLLDEIAEIPAKEAAKATYMLANGSGKKRMDKSGLAQESKEWRTLFMSSGEVSLSTHMSESGEMTRGGQLIRLVEIEADAGNNCGIFNHLPEGTDPRILADHLRQQCLKYYGKPIRAFIQQLLTNEDLSTEIENIRQAFLETIDAKGLSRQLWRAANRFSLIASAGVLASKFNILPIKEEEVLDSVKICFQNWMDQNSTHPDFETASIVSQVRHFLQTHGCSKFPEWDGVNKPTVQGQCLGYRLHRPGQPIRWLVLNEVFRKDLCKGFDIRKVTKSLRSSGFLITDNAGKNSTPMRLPHLGLVRVYHIDESIFQGV